MVGHTRASFTCVPTVVDGVVDNDAGLGRHGQVVVQVEVSRCCWCQSCCTLLCFVL